MLSASYQRICNHGRRHLRNELSIRAAQRLPSVHLYCAVDRFSGRTVPTGVLPAPKSTVTVDNGSSEPKTTQIEEYFDLAHLGYGLTRVPLLNRSLQIFVKIKNCYYQLNVLTSRHSLVCMRIDYAE